jgi:hypothetical protein
MSYSEGSTRPLSEADQRLRRDQDDMFRMLQSSGGGYTNTKPAAVPVEDSEEQWQEVGASRSSHRGSSNGGGSSNFAPPRTSRGGGRGNTNTNNEFTSHYHGGSGNGSTRYEHPLADRSAGETSTSSPRRPGARKTLMCLFYPACLHTAAVCKFLHLCTGYFPERGDPSCINPDCFLDHPTHEILVAAKSASLNAAAAAEKMRRPTNTKRDQRS